MRFFVISFLLLMMLGGFLHGAIKGNRYAQEGLEFYERGDYKKALDKFHAADRSAGGKQPEYLFWLGRLYIASADTTNAMEWFAKYSASGDLQYKKQVDSYQQIVLRQKKIFNRVSVRDLPDYINSRNSDYGAIPDPQGKYLYFTSMRPAPKGKENIWRVEIFRSGFGKPEFMEQLSTDKNEAFGCFTYDRSGAWIFGNYENSKRDGDIYYLALNNPDAVPQNITKLNTDQVETHPMVFRDRLMFFVSSRKGGYGGTDLYVSELFAGEWSEPQNLGPMVNTPDNEQTPFFAYDGKTLYFSSRGHAGFGGYDIFKASRIGPSWKDWSIPENLGLPVNSPQNDRYFYQVTGTNEGFISSDRAVPGIEKIYRVNYELTYPASYLMQLASGTVISVDIAPPVAVPKKQVNTDTVLSKIEQSLEVVKQGLPDRTYTPITIAGRSVSSDYNILPQPSVTIGGIITDQYGKPVFAEIELSYSIGEQQTKELVTTDNQGRFQISIPKADKYLIAAMADGHLINSQELVLRQGSMSADLPITLFDLDKIKSLPLDDIVFAFESSRLDSLAVARLENLVLTMLKNPEFKIRVSGHALDYGTNTYNNELSGKRSDAVLLYLTSRGIEKKRITVKNYGNTKPLPNSVTETQKAKNRRVELELYR